VIYGSNNTEVSRQHYLHNLSPLESISAPAFINTVLIPYNFFVCKHLTQIIIMQIKMNSTAPPAPPAIIGMGNPPELSSLLDAVCV